MIASLDAEDLPDAPANAFQAVPDAPLVCVEHPSNHDADSKGDLRHAGTCCMAVLNLVVVQSGKNRLRQMVPQASARYGWQRGFNYGLWQGLI